MSNVSLMLSAIFSIRRKGDEEGRRNRNEKEKNKRKEENDREQEGRGEEKEGGTDRHNGKKRP